MKLIIAEKPSVRDSIAHALGAYKKLSSDGGKNFCYCNDEYYIANSIGHLYGLGNPTEYGFARSFAESYKNGELPMLPVFSSFPCDDDPGKNDLRDFLAKLINKNDVDEIICATDAAREGELIFREIYYASGSSKPVSRLWISSVTDAAIIDGMRKLKPDSEYDSYYRCAKIRSELDWIFGLNLSRLYSVLDNDIRPVGRVLTPALAIIAERDEKVFSFSPSSKFRLQLHNGAESDISYETKEEAERNAASGSNTDVRVMSVACEEKSENRPLLYNLTSLQQEMSKKYGMKAIETLEAAQNLYEKKYTTYPRTDGEYLTEDMRTGSEETVKKLSEIPKFKAQADKILNNGLNADSRVYNDSKLGDHHAIIPTLNGNINLSALNKNELAVYEAVVLRFLSVFDKKHTYKQYTYKFWCNDIDYTLSLKKTVDIGWREFNKSDDKTEEKEIPGYTEGEVFSSSEIKVREIPAEKPRHYTDGTLVSAMNNIDNRIEDKELSSAVKGKGIGTSTTRADIIEKIILSGYAERQGKYIVTTKFGRDFVGSLPSQIKSVERTAEWEQEFEDIINRNISSDRLYEETKDIVRRIIDFEKTNTTRKIVVNENSPRKAQLQSIGKCPRCGNDIVDRGKFYGCTSYKSSDDKGCGFSFGKTHNKGWFKGEISAAKAKALVAHEKIKLTAVSSEGKEYEALWELADENGFINLKKFGFEEVIICKCPRCSNNIVERKSSYSCTSYKSAEDKGCGFVLWKNDKRSGLEISPKNAAALISGKIISVKVKTISGDTLKKVKLTEREQNGIKYLNIDEVRN